MVNWPCGNGFGPELELSSQIYTDTNRYADTRSNFIGAREGNPGARLPDWESFTHEGYVLRGGVGVENVFACRVGHVFGKKWKFNFKLNTPNSIHFRLVAGGWSSVEMRGTWGKGES